MKTIATLFLTTLLSVAAFAQSSSGVNVDTAVTASVAYSQAVGPTVVNRAQRYAVQAVVTNSTPSAHTFTCAASDICTWTAHGMLTGLKVQVSTTTTLPAGLSASTDYYVIKLSANTFSLATSLVNAQAGTAIDITDAGTGTHTITPTALAGASVKLQRSMDNSNWSDVPIKATGDATKSASITASGVFMLSDDNMAYNYIRTYYTLTAGQLSVSNIGATRVDR